MPSSVGGVEQEAAKTVGKKTTFELSMIYVARACAL